MGLLWLIIPIVKTNKIICIFLIIRTRFKQPKIEFNVKGNMLLKGLKDNNEVLYAFRNFNFEIK